MTKKELIALADKHQEKAEKAYKNYEVREDLRLW